MSESFHAAVSAWQNFYLLLGTAAATLTGLMFLAITFGSSLVTKKTVAAASAFTTPTYSHFVQILLTCCFLTIPTMNASLLGVLLLLMTGARLVAMFEIFGQMKTAHRKNGDIEASDWLLNVALPLGSYLLLVATGAAFLQGQDWAFNALAGSLIVLLLVGIQSAWELLVWMVVRVNEGKKK